jgi:invasion protein IalB
MSRHQMSRHGDGPMSAFRIAAGALPVLLAGALAASIAFAQQSPSPPAAKPSAPKAAAPKPAAPAPAAAVAAGGDAQPSLLGQYGDWGAYAASPGGNRVCFALAKPKTSKTEPAGRSRDQSYVFISSRPAEKVKHEVSVIIGYPFKTSSDATAEIGTAKFAMYTQNDGAWIKNITEEARMVDAMRKGTDLTVKGTSGRGTQSTDQFSLKGLAQALDKIEQECK